MNTITNEMIMERLDRIERLVRVIGIHLIGEDTLVSKAVDLIQEPPERDYADLQDACKTSDEMYNLKELALNAGVLWECEVCDAASHRQDTHCMDCRSPRKDP